MAKERKVSDISEAPTMQTYVDESVGRYDVLHVRVDNGYEEES